MDQDAGFPRETRVCPDCRGRLQPIRLIDKAHYGLPEQLEYTQIDAKPEFWTGLVPTEGKIEAFICLTCSRVLLYGSPRQENNG